MRLEKEVVDFLRRFKKTAQNHGLRLVPRKKNLDAIARMGVTLAAAEEMILRLTPKEYVSGPEKNHDGTSGEVWVFGKEEDDKVIYIKLKLDGASAKCLSFHPAQYGIGPSDSR